VSRLRLKPLTERYSISEMASSFDAVADTIEAALAGRPTSFSWKALLDGRPASADERRGLISVWAKLDYSNLEPGQAASPAIRDATDSAKLKSDFNSDLKLTGQVPLADAEFASLREGALANGITGGSSRVDAWIKRIVPTVGIGGNSSGLGAGGKPLQLCVIGQAPPCLALP
jgi:hypothetical protein